MSDIRSAIEKLRKLEAEATEGPWESDLNVVIEVGQGDRIASCDGGYLTSNGQRQVEDAYLIAQTRNQLSLALDVIEAANAAEHLIRQHLGPCGYDILKALAAWADHVNGEGSP